MGAANSYVLMYYDKYKHVQVTDGHLSLQDLPLVPITKGKKSYKELDSLLIATEGMFEDCDCGDKLQEAHKHVVSVLHSM